MSQAALSRVVPVRILMPLGWIPCSFSIPRLAGFRNWIDHQGAVLRPTSARVPGRAGMTTSFALERSAALLIVPDEPAELLEVDDTAGPRVQHEVTALLDIGAVHGRLDAPSHVVVSEWLLHHRGFALLGEATFTLAGPSRGSTPTVPAVLVNCERVLGVVEGAAGRPAGRPMKALPAPPRKPRR